MPEENSMFIAIRKADARVIAKGWTLNDLVLNELVRDVSNYKPTDVEIYEIAVTRHGGGFSRIAPNLYSKEETVYSWKYD